MKKQTFSSTQTKVKVVTAVALIGGGIAAAAAIGYVGLSYLKPQNLKFDKSQWYKPYVKPTPAGYNAGYIPGYTPGYVPGYYVPAKTVKSLRTR